MILPCRESWVKNEKYEISADFEFVLQMTLTWAQQTNNYCKKEETSLLKSV